MAYTGRVDNITITEIDSRITLTVADPQAWDNEPDTKSIIINQSSIPNLIAALNDIQRSPNSDDDGWW